MFGSLILVNAHLQGQFTYAPLEFSAESDHVRFKLLLKTNKKKRLKIDSLQVLTHFISALRAFNKVLYTDELS